MTPQFISFLILLAGFSLGCWLVAHLYQQHQERQAQLQERIRELKRFYLQQDDQANTVLIDYRSRKHLDEHARNLTFFDRVQLKLEKAGVGLSPIPFLFIYCLCIGLFFSTAWVVFQFSLSTSICVGLGVGGTAPLTFLTMLENRRKNAFLNLFPESLDIMVRGIRSGMSVQRALHTIAEEMRDPISSEFYRITDQMKIGQLIEVALAEASHRLNLDDFRFFAVAMIIQKETGGNLSEALGNLSVVIRKRHEMRMKIKALTSEARASAIIVGCLPFLAAGALSVMNPEHLAPFFSTAKGRSLMGVAVGMMATGIFTIMRMIRFRI